MGPPIHRKRAAKDPMLETTGGPRGKSLAQKTTASTPATKATQKASCNGPIGKLIRKLITWISLQGLSMLTATAPWISDYRVSFNVLGEAMQNKPVTKVKIDSNQLTGARGVHI